jgi:3-hydroxyacyl-[acyl-carrier-protein] dehydratase
MMVLQGDFYRIREKNSSGNQVSAVIELNVDHAIYKGHFPQQPIVPGVCQVQIIKELLEGLMGKKLQMTHGDNIKFTGMIIPTQSPVVNLEVNYQLKESEIICDAKLFFEGTMFTKYKGKFKAVL